MSNTIPPVLIELQLETAALKVQMEQINKRFSDFGDTVKKQTSFLSNFKAAATGVFAGNLMTRGLVMVEGAIRGAIAEAQSYEKATAQLNAGIISTGNLAGLSVRGLQAQAAALESLSAQDEIAIMKNQALLQTFTNVRNVTGEGNDIFNQATLAMLNMGAKMGDNAGSAMQLGKALNDPLMGMNALRRVGVVFTEQQKEAIKAMVASGDIMGAQKIILQELEVEFGGSAKAAGDTFAGAIFRAKDKVADFARSLITNLQPILLTIGKTIGDLWNKYLTPLFKIINDNKEALLLFVGVLAAGYAAFKVYNGIMGVVKTTQTLLAVAQVLLSGGQLASIASTNGLAASMLRLNAIMRANPIGLIVAAVALLAAGFVILWNKSETFRKVMIEVGKAGLTAVAFLIRMFGDLAQIILKVYSGPLRLLLTVLSKLPGVGKYAKAGLDLINNGIENVGEFADKVADKVEGFKSTLDGLADKKIKIPGFGKDKPADDVILADAPGGGLTAAQIAAAKAAAKQKAEDLAKANKDVQASYEKMNKVIVDAKDRASELTTDYDKKIASINTDSSKRQLSVRQDYAKKELEIYKNFAEQELSIRKSYADKTVQLQKDAEIRRANIIQKSKDLIIGAFKGVTGIDVGSLFAASFNKNSELTQTLFGQVKDGVSTSVSWWGKVASVGVGGLINDLKTKLLGAKTLADNAAKLAAQGYSQTFIQQIVSQGAGIGNQMADAILNSSPEAQSELRNLYSEIETLSESGVNKLADTMYDGMGLANKTLRDEYSQVAIDLKKSLLENSVSMTEALNDNAKNLQESLLKNQDELNGALTAIQTDLQDALLDAQIAYNEAIAELEKDTKDKLAELQSDLKKTAETIKQLSGAKAVISALANSPAAPILTGTSSLGLVNKSGGTVVINNNTNISGTNLADPNETADTVANAMRFGSTQSLTTAQFFEASYAQRMGANK